MKKIISILTALLLVLSLVACQSKKAEPPIQTQTPTATPTSAPTPTKVPTAVDKIKQAGKIIVGTESTFPPYESVDPKDGKTIIGFDIDLAQAIATKLGVKLEIVDMNFDGLILALLAGKLDFIAAGMAADEKRKKSVDFSQIYYRGGQILVVKDSISSINTAADMNGKKIGAQLGSVSEKAAQTIPGIKYKAMDKVDQLMLSVKNGMLDGVVVDDTVGVNYAKSIGGLKVVKMEELNKGESGMGLPVQKGNEELLQVMNDTINELKSNGEFNKLVDKWGLLKQ